MRVAYIGVGNRGSWDLKAGLAAGLKVEGVCDLLPERADAASTAVAKAGGSAKTFTDFRKMLDELKGIDAVVAATPDYTHPEVYPAVLERGFHLYGEKPLAPTAAEAKRVVAAVKKSGKKFQAGFQLRHDPARNAAEKFIHSGGLGKVLMCHGIRHGGDLPRNIPWYFDKTKCGDIVVDQGIHILDLFTWAIGSHPVRAMGTGGTTLFVDDPPGRTVMDNYSLVYEYANGMQVNFSHHYFDPPGFTGVQERVFGSKGAIDLPKATWTARAPGAKPQKLDVPNDGIEATEMAMRSFIGSIRDDKPVMSNADEALVATLTAILGTRAIYEKRIVKWEEVAG